MGEPIPIYLINGLLESGKTTFIRPMLESGDFTEDERTLLLLCEDGEEEYDEQALLYHDVALIPVEKESDMTPEFLRGLKKKYRPTQIVMEWNGMWTMEHLIKDLPRDPDAAYLQLTTSWLDNRPAADTGTEPPTAKTAQVRVEMTNR